MRYGSEGGKRLRALIVYATGEALGTPAEHLDAPACAVELIHAYSLVHDDLPAMDNDALRRGRPTVHVAYGEANGILVGDALLTLAFEVLAGDTVNDAAARIAMVARLADAAGSRGMVGGQAVDIESEGRHLALEALKKLHAHKTGALILSALRMAACTAPALATDQRAALDTWGRCVGLAFQIQDDVLDVESSTEKLGKTQGKDEAQDKSTYVALLGLESAKQRAAVLFDEARAAIACFGPHGRALKQLADHIQQRDH
ncbi:MAG: geranyl transferase [Nevskiaceae bacterium]|nr:MAG: geranyl transferase [Nevskiaceae bacterium]TBR73197.1 MAG: geranyl transferase [Nevskiaceae bacterium]